MSNEDPSSSSTASCPSPGKCTPCQPLLPPSSAPLGAPRGSGRDGYSPGRVSPQWSVLLGHMLSPPCKPSPSVSTSQLPLCSPLASPPVPRDPKPAACCPSCAAMTFSCCQEKGSCSCLHWKKQQLFFPTLCSLQSCRFAGVSELGLSNAGCLPQALDPAGATLDASGARQVCGTR